jgi:hypothetical protein
MVDLKRRDLDLERGRTHGSTARPIVSLPHLPTAVPLPLSSSDSKIHLYHPPILSSPWCIEAESQAREDGDGLP